MTEEARVVLVVGAGPAAGTAVGGLASADKGKREQHGCEEEKSHGVF